MEWSFAGDGYGAGGRIRVRPGGAFRVTARNHGAAAVRAEIDLSRVVGLHLFGSASRLVPPGQAQSFELSVVGAPPTGRLLMRSEDAPRPHWWRRRAWREEAREVDALVTVREELWRAGTPVLLFPPGVPQQSFRIWNDAETAREAAVADPPGAGLTYEGEPAAGRMLRAGPQAALHFQARVRDLRTGGRVATWSPLPDLEEGSLHVLPSPPSDPGPDAIVGIDFGTRNTSVLVRWRRTLIPSRPAGSVDAVGDQGSTPRFPTEMVLHLREETFRWGTDAARAIAGSRLSPEDVPVINLKTYIREGIERFARLRPEWTNAELLRRLFERIVRRLDDYFGTVEPGFPVVRDSLSLRYVVGRPVLDANEGDDRGRAYEAQLRQALAACGIPERAIHFVHEPVAAAIGIARSREEALLSRAEGDPVAVVDSGGGTTDVALARVRLRNGQVQLDLAGSYALRLGPDNPALVALRAYGHEERTEVGGNVLDFVLAHRLSVAAQDVLDSDGGKPVPRSLWSQVAPPEDEPPERAAARLREFILICRRLKERFASASTQYLNRPPGEEEPGEVVPFPHRADLQGIYLDHLLYDEKILGPVLLPVVQELSGRIGRSQEVSGGIRPSHVRQVFFVGGTCADPGVRVRLSRLFPLADPENDPQSQSPERIQERMMAVARGAVWFDEQLFATAPVGARLRLQGEEIPLFEAGATLLPPGIASPRFFTRVVGPGEELQAELLVAAPGLAEDLLVARGHFRNETAEGVATTLITLVDRERGVTAQLQVGDRRIEQWQFSLVSPP